MVFEIYKAFASSAEQAELRQRFATGIGWGEAKDIVFDKINSEIAPFRERYNQLMTNPTELEQILEMGAIKARRDAQKRMEKVRKAIGIKPLAKLKK